MTTKRSYTSNPGSHQRVRADHLTEIAEDYVELISHLIEEMGEARTSDIAERLGVTQVTVTKTLQRLQRNGYVSTKPYRSVFLTDAGRVLADHAHNRHQMVFNFLLKLGVSPETAEADSEGIEHHVSEETLQKMRDFVEKS